MTAGDEQEQIWKRNLVGKADGKRVRFQVIDRNKRLSGGQCQGLRHRYPNNNAADQAGPGGDADRVQILEAYSGLAERLLDNGL